MKSLPYSVDRSILIEADREVVFGFFKRDEDAAFAALRAADQKLKAEKGLAAAGAAADKCRPASRQTAAGDVVESEDARRGLRESVGARRAPHAVHVE